MNVTTEHELGHSLTHFHHIQQASTHLSHQHTSATSILALENNTIDKNLKVHNLSEMQSQAQKSLFLQTEEKLVLQVQTCYQMYL